MPEYIYIRQVNQSSVHMGYTTDPEKRYSQSADQAIEDIKEYLYIFECVENKGEKIEADIKIKFKQELVDNTSKKEKYLWNTKKEKSM